MDTPIFSTKQYLNAAIFNTYAGIVTSSVVNALTALCGIGIINYEQIDFTTPTALVQNITFGTDVQVIFPAGISQAHGTTPNSDTQNYTIDLTPYVPVSGSQLVLIYVSYFALGMAPITIVGPPQAHPNYNASFQPYNANSYTRDSLSVGAAANAVPSGSIEIARTTLTAGQTGSVVLESQALRTSAYTTTFATTAKKITGNYSASITESGATLQLATAGAILTLPPPNTTQLSGEPMLTYYIQAVGGSGTVTISSPGTFVGGAITGESSVSLSENDYLAVQSDNTNYVVLSATPNVVGISQQFPSLLTTDGWKRYPDPNSPSGFFIEQWGTTSVSGSGASNVITWPILFPNAVLTAQVSFLAGSVPTDAGSIGITASNAAQGIIETTHSSGGGSFGVYYSVKGY